MQVFFIFLNITDLSFRSTILLVLSEHVYLFYLTCSICPAQFSFNSLLSRLNVVVLETDKRENGKKIIQSKYESRAVVERKLYI